MLTSIMFFSTGSGPGADVVYRRIADIARRAEAEGMTRIWLPERHFVEFGAVHPAPAVLAAALASKTRSIRLAAGSVVAPIDDPIRIAEAWSVVDNLSGGRVDLSLASGWRSEDFALAPDRYADRHQILEDNTKAIRRLWRGEALHRKDGTGKTVAICTQPRPVQSELPLWITAARKSETFKLAGALGANLLTYLVDLGFEGLETRIADYRVARAAAGLDPRAGLVTVMLHTHLADSAAEARARARGPYIRSILRNRALLDPHAAALLNEGQAEQIAEAQFERLFERLSLIGSVEAGTAIVDRLAKLGVDEIACLIDFIDDFDIVDLGLPKLSRLVAHSHAMHTQRVSNGKTRSSSHESQHTAAEFYAYIGSIGGYYGSSFRGIEKISLDENHAKVALALPDGASTPDPILIDTVVSTGHVFALRAALRGSMRPLALPIGIDRMRIKEARSDRYTVTARAVTRDALTAKFDIDVVTEAGAPVASFEGVAFRRLPLGSDDPRTISALSTLHRVAWTHLDVNAQAAPITWTPCCAELAAAPPLSEALAATFAPGAAIALIVPQRTAWHYGDREKPRAAAMYVLGEISRLRAERRTESIVVLVNGAHGLPGDDFLPDPAAAAAWAAAGSVCAAPGCAQVRVLDLPPDSSPFEIAHALRAFLASDDPKMAAIRGKKLLVPGLFPVATPNIMRDREPPGRVLVTGGRGHLGTLLTDWLLEDGVNEVVVMSRGSHRRTEHMLRAGGHTIDLWSDVSALTADTNTIFDEGFDAIFHLAGKDLGDATDAGAIDEVFAPKFDGLLAVAERIAASGTPAPLVLFASSAALVGATGQPAYAAANAAAVAAAAHVRRHTGLTVLALALDPVRGIGMAAGSQVERSLSARAIVPLDPSTALRAIGFAVAAGLDDVAIITPGNQSAMQTVVSTGRPVTTSIATGASILGDLHRLDKPATRQWMIDRIRQEMAEILEVLPDEIDTRANLYDIGVDSVMALELRNILKQKYGVQIGLAPLMEAQCLEDVASAILSAVGRPPPQRTMVTESPDEIVL